MTNFNIDSLKKRTYDAIVIGSGISGGWAAKELTEKKLKTLVLERGRDVKHIQDYPTTMKEPWEFEHRGQMPLEAQKANPILGKLRSLLSTNLLFQVPRRRTLATQPIAHVAVTR